MYSLYSFFFSLAFVLMLPLFLLRREKYAAGFRQRLGNYPEFKHDGRKVIWLHCVSVGETNASRPLVEQLKLNFPDHRLVISTTTKTGQGLAISIFKGQADAVFYFPFDWKFSVRRALRHFKPDIVLLMETEIWFNFFNEASKSGVKLAIINGRLSAKSVQRYSYIKGFMLRVLNCVDQALMQGEADAQRILSLGIDHEKVKVTENIKFDFRMDESEMLVTEAIRERFGLDGSRPLIVAASTHPSEEEWILRKFTYLSIEHFDINARLLIAPRHPERFEEVAEINASSIWVGGKSKGGFSRRSEAASETDKSVDIILLDTIGELRAVYPLADIVFVGGSLIPHGGQSILEPAAAGKAIITGPYTHNFDAVVKEFLTNNALIQLPESPDEFQIAERLYEVFVELLENPQKRHELGTNAASVMKANQGATVKTIEYLKPLLDKNVRNRNPE